MAKGYSRNPSNPLKLDTISASQLMAKVRQDTGKVVMLNVWATWCDACREEMPGIVKLRKNHLKDNFELILFSADDLDEKKVIPTLRKLGVDFPSYIKSDSSDEEFIASLHPGWSGALPTTFLFDKHGNFNEIIVGERTFEQYEKRVKRLLSE
ncbi:MAG: TlpA disulfide reductase family protein [Bacteroidota bacterium]